MVLQAAKAKLKKKQKNFSDKKIAVIVSLFNEDICRSLLEGAWQELLRQRIPEKNIRVFEVAGAFEIPLMAKKVAETKKYAGMVALSCVIKGDTPHFDYVCKAVTDGCLRVQLDTGCPLAFGVLTVNNKKQAELRSQQNKFNKGRESVLALFDTLQTMETL